jgi:hypothetical protein
MPPIQLLFDCLNPQRETIPVATKSHTSKLKHSGFKSSTGDHSRCNLTQKTHTRGRCLNPQRETIPVATSCILSIALNCVCLNPQRETIPVATTWTPSSPAFPA